mgnify:FL=1
MKLFLVKIKILVDGFEKYTAHLVRAIDSESAGERALLNECHNNLGDGAEMQSPDVCEDDYGGMIYAVHVIKEVEPEHEAIVTLYMS